MLYPSFLSAIPPKINLVVMQTHTISLTKGKPTVNVKDVNLLLTVLIIKQIDEGQQNK